MTRHIGAYAADLAGILLLGLVTMAVPVAGTVPRQPNATERAASNLATLTSAAQTATQDAAIKATINAPGGRGPLPASALITADEAANLVEVARYDHTRFGSSAWSRDGRYFVEHGSGGWLLLYDVLAGLAVREVLNTGDLFWSLAVSDDATLVAGSGPVLYLWDVATGAELATLDDRAEFGLDMDFSPDGTLLAVSYDDGFLAVYDTITFERLFLEWTNAEVAYSVAFSPDGTTVATGGAGAGAQLRDARTGALRDTLPDPTRNIAWSAAFSTDGTLLATGNSANEIRLWDVDGLSLAGTLLGHSDWVRGVAFSPDGTLLISGSADSTVRVWDVATQTELVVLSGHTDTVKSITFSPDGTLILSVGADAQLIVWGLPQ